MATKGDSFLGQIPPPHPPAKSYGRHGVGTTVYVVSVGGVILELQISVPIPPVHTDGYIILLGGVWSQELFEMSGAVAAAAIFTS